MRLVVEEAQDHSTCMEIVRQRHGADCVVVHSFRVEDQYRIVVALETEASRPALSALNNAVRDVIAPVAPAGNIKWDTFIDDVSEATPVAAPAIKESVALHAPRAEVQTQPSPEVSSGLIALAARIKALEAAHKPTILEPETEEFRTVVFSDVLAEAVTADRPDTVETAPEALPEATPHNTSISTESTPLSVTPFEIPMVAVKDLDWTPPPKQSFASSEGDEPVVPRVFTSEGAENFATLLSGCIAVASKSMSLSGQTQLKMVSGQGI